MYKSQLRWMFEGLNLVGQVVKVVRQASATDLLISETTGKPLKQFQVVQDNTLERGH